MEKSDSKYCVKCGSSIPEGSQFCYRCGAKQRKDDACNNTVEISKKGKIPKWVWVIVILLVLSLLKGRAQNNQAPDSSNKPVDEPVIPPEVNDSVNIDNTLNTLSYQDINLDYIDPIVLTYSIKNEEPQDIYLLLEGKAYYDDVYMGKFESATLSWESEFRINSSQKVIFLILIEPTSEVIDGLASRTLDIDRNKWSFQQVSVTIIYVDTMNTVVIEKDDLS